VADTTNYRIRKIVISTRVVTTFAGSSSGFGDGTGTSALFYNPSGVAVDISGNLFVADTGNHRIRKIVISSAVVTTLAGSGSSGFQDGTGTSAIFNCPSSIAVDTSGNLFVSDQNNHRIRKIQQPTWTKTGSLGYTGEDGVSLYSARSVPSAPAKLRDSQLDVTTGNIYNYDYSILVSSLAGRGLNFAEFADGPGETATFSNPHGIAIDTSGNLFVADTYNDCIRKIVISTGIVSTLAGSGSGGFADGQGDQALFNNPISLVLDTSGNIYVADLSNSRIRKITPGGYVTTYAGSGVNGFLDAPSGPASDARFSAIHGITIDASGTLFLSDGGRIRKVTSNGYVTTLAGNTNPNYETQNGTGANALFGLPWGIIINASGTIFVTDALGNRIQKITPPDGYTWDSSNSVIDSSGNGGGIVTTLAGNGQEAFADGISSAASFKTPAGIAFDANGNILVADTWNNRIRRVTLEGVVTTIAGNGLAGYVDGIPANSSFRGPRGIVVDTVGNIYIADTFNSTIRRISFIPTLQWSVIGSLGYTGHTGMQGDMGTMGDTGPIGDTGPAGVGILPQVLFIPGDNISTTCTIDLTSVPVSTRYVVRNGSALNTLTFTTPLSPVLETNFYVYVKNLGSSNVTVYHAPDGSNSTAIDANNSNIPTSVIYKPNNNQNATFQYVFWDGSNLVMV
jgi:sugar lactone lactonase YvrE